MFGVPALSTGPPHENHAVVILFGPLLRTGGVFASGAGRRTFFKIHRQERRSGRITNAGFRKQSAGCFGLSGPPENVSFAFALGIPRRERAAAGNRVARDRSERRRRGAHDGYGRFGRPGKIHCALSERVEAMVEKCAPDQARIFADFIKTSQRGILSHR